MNNRIALAGPAGVGKSTIANELTRIFEYEQRSIGDIIKRDLMGFIEEWKNGAVYPHSLATFVTGLRGCMECDRVMGNLWYLREIESLRDSNYLFTVERTVKDYLRPILECYGVWKYKQFFEEFFDTLPGKVVNSRISESDEVHKWLDIGGEIWLVSRPGVEVATSWERKCIDYVTDNKLYIRNIVLPEGKVQMDLYLEGAFSEY